LERLSLDSVVISTQDLKSFKLSV